MKEALIAYLERLIADVSKLPQYMSSVGQFDFGRIRQRVRVSRKKPIEKNQEPKDNKEKEEIEIVVEDWERLRKEQQRAVILGDPGYGKTWLLKHEAYRTAKELLKQLNQSENLGEIVIPIHLHLPTLARSLDAKTTLFDLVLSCLETDFGLSGDQNITFRTWLLGQLKAGHCFLLFDAFDEVSENRDLLRNQLQKHLPHEVCPFLITSRRTNYQGLAVFAPTEASYQSHLQLVDFEWEQIDNFVDAWFEKSPDRAQATKAQLKASQQLHGLACVPLLLSFICLIAEKEPELPDNPLDVYDRAVSKILAVPWDENKPERNEELVHDKRNTLEKIVLECSGIKNGLWSSGLLAESVCEITTPEERTSLIQDGILTRSGEGREERYQFPHATFQEYFAACALSRDVNSQRLFLRAYFNPDIHQTEILPMTLGLTKNPSELYKRLDRLPESLEFLNFRLQLRGLRFVKNLDSQLIDHLGERLIIFARWDNEDKIPYTRLVIEAASTASTSAKELFSSKLISLLNYKDLLIKQQAIQYLSDLGHPSDKVISSLKLIIENDSYHSNLPMRALLALSQLGEKMDIQKIKVFGQAWPLREVPNNTLSWKEPIAADLLDSETLFDLLVLICETDPTLIFKSAKSLKTKNFISWKTTTYHESIFFNDNLMSILKSNSLLEEEIFNKIMMSQHYQHAVIGPIISDILALRFQSANVLQNFFCKRKEALLFALNSQSYRVRLKATQMAGFYFIDRDLLNNLHNLQESDPNDEVRQAARDAAERYQRKLELLQD